MTSTQQAPPRPSSRVLGGPAALSAVVLAVAGVGLVLDSRVITGAPAWLTPLELLSHQVVRGTTSHVNDATPFDVTVVGVVGGLVSLVFLAAAVAAALVWRGTMLPVSLASAARR